VTCICELVQCGVLFTKYCAAGNLCECVGKNNEREKELNKLKNELKKYIDKEMSEKKVLHMGLERIEEANKIQENEREGPERFESCDTGNIGPPVG
jgi:hypothetical protein